MIKNLLLIILFFTGNIVYSQSCSVNAGANVTICGTSTTLQGSSSGTTSGTPTWSIVSKPAGAPDPVFSNPNSYTPGVTGMTFPGNYVFMITQPCSSSLATSQMTVTAPGDVSTFTAGPDITNITAATGVATLSAVVPAGYTASWIYYNLYNYETFPGSMVITNATMTNTTTATPTLTLTKKTNHNADPAYRAVLRITSVNNPSCWYEDDAIVRFIPNINLVYPAVTTQCISSSATGNPYYMDAISTSPVFSSSSANSAGNPAFGTTITMNVISQPSGGNIKYSFIQNGRVFFSGIGQTGDYVFTLTIANSTGSYTTPQITYRYNGFQPSALSFQDASYPNQIRVSSDGYNSGAVYCNMINSTAPITTYFKVNSADSPSVVTTVAVAGTIPAGGSPTISAVSGAGTLNRSVTFTPPAGGWKIGTYRFNMTTTSAGGCSVTQVYLVHISDGARPDVDVPDMAVCYPGSGVVSATVPLPGFQGIVNASYFQYSVGTFTISLVSKPAGSATPVVPSYSLGAVSTVISNMDKPGEYVFKIQALAAGANAGDFLTAEYACSGTSREGTFSIFVATQVNSNAGSDQLVVTASSTATVLNGNNPGVATGTWSLVSKPSGAPDPVIVTPSAYNSNVTGFTTVGAYTFRWTVTTGSSCTSSDDMIVNVAAGSPGGVPLGLSYWYRADKNAVNTGAGTDVTGWTDMWNGTTVAQLGTNALPKYVLGTPTYFNFNAGINFTAATQTIGNNTVQTLTSLNYDVFTLTKEGMTSTGTNPRLFSIGMDNTTIGITNWDAFGINATSNVLERRVYNAGSQLLAVNPIYNLVIPSIMYFRNTNTSTIKGLNGSGLGTSVPYAAQGSQFGGHIFGSSLFSSNASDNSGFVGNVGETIVYGAGTLSDTDRRKVDSYLAIKYGITLGQVSTAHYLDTAGNIVWNGASNTTYNNNIFGVSRDDIEVFQQKVSRSVNAAGANLTIATTADFLNSNQDAARTGFANDKTYFLLGDNNVAIPTLTSLTVAGTAMNRIQRAWLSQRQNTLGSLYFESNLASYGNAFLPGNNVLMVVADDAAFTTNVKTVAGSYVGAKWVFNNSFDSDNVQRYITFATVAKDSDGDGVPDYSDLDNDNDGILDTNECYGEKVTNGTFTGGSTGWTLGGGWGYGGDALSITNDAADNATLEQTLAPLSTQMYKLTFSLGSTDWKFTTTTQTASFTIKLGGVTYAVINNAAGRTNNVTMTLSNGASSNFVAYSSTDAQSNTPNVTIYIPYSYFASQINKLQFVVSATGDDWYLDNVSLTGGCDTDGDGIPDYLDLDSDNDGCADALEGGDTLAISNLVTAGGTLQGGNGIAPVATPTSGTYNKAVLLNLCNVSNGSCVGTTGIPSIVNQTTGQTVGTSTNSTVRAFVCTYCYKPGVTTGAALDTKVGITSLSRAGSADADNWPMARKGGWLALEAKTKGFVPNRIKFNASNLPVADDGATLILTSPVEGMMVYDVTNKCMKIYTTNGTAFGWYCLTTQTCPDGLSN